MCECNEQTSFMIATARHEVNGRCNNKLLDKTNKKCIIKK